MESSSEHNRNLSTIFGFVSEEIQRAPDGLPGSKIGLLLRHRVPGFRPIEFGFKNLKELLLSSADPGFCVVGHVLGKEGGDVLYGLRKPGTVTSSLAVENVGSEVSSLSSSHWRTFSSPDSAFRLYLRKDGSIEQRPLASPQSSELVPISSLSASDHRAIAADFAANVEGEAGDALKSLSHDPDEKWFLRYWEETRQRDLEKRWKVFRNRKIIEEFNQRVRVIGIPLRYRATPPPLAIKHMPVAAEKKEICSADDFFRKVLSRCVEDMTIDPKIGSWVEG